MKKWRGIRFISILLAAVLMISEFNVTAFAGEIDIVSEEETADDTIIEENFEEVFEEQEEPEEYFEDDYVDESEQSEEPEEYTDEVSEEEIVDYSEDDFEEESEEMDKDTEETEELSIEDAEDTEEVDSEDEELASELLPMQYSLKFNIQSGSGIENDPANIEFAKTYNNYDGKNPTAFTLRPAKKNGYTFMGWENAAGKLGVKITSIPRNAKKVYELQAMWKPTVYKITYKLNGTAYPVSGIKMPAKKTTYTIEDETYTIPKPTATGYKFVGWQFETTFSSEGYVKEIKRGQTGNLTLIGYWAPIKYTVNYYADGKKTVLSSEHQYKSKSDKLISITESSYFSKPGYHVQAWCTDENLKKGNYKPSAIVNTLCTKDGGSVNLYAKFASNTYTIAYDGNGAIKGKVANTKCTYGKNVTLARNSFVKPGFVFDGWNTKPDGEGLEYAAAKKAFVDGNLITDETLPDKSTVTLYARWRPAKYTIKFNSPKSPKSQAMQPIETECGKDVKLWRDDVFTRDGYGFDTWRSTTKVNGNYLEYKVGKTVSGGLPIAPTKDGTTITFRPVWTWDLHILDDAGKKVKDYKIEDGKTFKLPSYKEFFDERLGYSFLGWYNNSSKSFKLYCGDKAVIRRPIEGSLYGMWTPISYTIKINWTATSSKTEKIDLQRESYKFPSTDKLINGVAVTGYEMYNVTADKWENIKDLGEKKGESIKVATLIKKYADGKNVIKLRPITEEFRVVNGVKLSYEVGDKINLDELLNVSTIGYSEINATNWKSANPAIVSIEDPNTPYIFTAKKEGKTDIYLVVKNKKIKVNIQVGCPPMTVD